MMEREQTESSDLTNEDVTDVTQQTTDEVKSVARRFSEVLDAIDKADDVTEEGEMEEEDIISQLAGSKVRGEAKISVGSDNFYSSNNSERERERSPSDKSCKVNVLRSIPGDDSGLEEELVLVISKDQLQEQDRRGVIRARWFLHSLEQLELLDKLEPKVGGHQSHVCGDRVRAVMMFNTVRKDVREREYVMSEAGYSTVMALVGGVLEAAALASSGVSSLQCVKCQAVFTWRGRGRADCPHCGSSMVLETEQCRGEEEEEVSLGIPACEMLDLEAITEAAGGERVETVTDLAELEQSESRAMSVTADIHNHLVPGHHDNLPDLLPRPEPRRSSSPGETRESKERSSSPTLTRSNSSSDISVISSEASIEVIPPSGNAHLAPPAALTKTSAVSPVLAVLGDSSSSESSQLVNSQLTLESCQSPLPSTPQVFKTPFSTPVKRQEDSPSSPFTIQHSSQ